MAGFTVGNTNIFTSNTFSGTFNGFTSTNQLVFEAAPVFQGSVSGYTAGGQPAPTTDFNVIDKYPFASDTNATDVGDLTQKRRNGAGQSSTENGYNSGGADTDGVGPLGVDTIDKFPFATDTNATDAGNLSQIRRSMTGQSSTTNGYSSGGLGPTSPSLDTIDKFPFATDSGATDVGDLTRTVNNPAGQSSTTHGYTSGGNSPPGGVGNNFIDKFPFATDTGAADVGNLAEPVNETVGQSSTTHGYISGGEYEPAPSPQVDFIQKFPFAVDANATDIANLTSARRSSAGQSATTHGYITGGHTPTILNNIEKFSFESDANATDVGDMTISRQQPMSGNQV